jgi:hypothetical protein
MKKLKSVFLAAACLSVLALTVSLVTSTPTPSAPPPPPPPVDRVEVVNTPLPVQGTVSANITNSVLPVSGAVSVTSLPAVTLNGTSPVSLSNTESSAVYVVEAYAAAANNAYGGRTPPTAGSTLSPYSGGQNNCTGFDPVPTGFVLVADMASLSAEVPPGTLVQNAYFGFTANATDVLPFVYMVPTKVGSFNGNDYYVASAPIRAYIPATASGTVQVGITTTIAAGATLTPFAMTCTVYGHLVPAS